MPVRPVSWRLRTRRKHVLRMSLRRISPLAAIALALAGLSALGLGQTSDARKPQKQQKPASFLVSGRGWGHGVGLSQWGAYGFARQGATYDQILGHYYQGTTL